MRHKEVPPKFTREVTGCPDTMTRHGTMGRDKTRHDHYAGRRARYLYARLIHMHETTGREPLQLNDHVSQLEMHKV